MLDLTLFLNIYTNFLVKNSHFSQVKYICVSSQTDKVSFALFALLNRNKVWTVGRELQLKDGVKFLFLSYNVVFFPTHKNSCRRWERVEGGGTGPRANTVFFLPPPGRKRNFHHWLIYGPLGFPLEIRKSFWIPLTPLYKNKCCFVSYSSASSHTHIFVI